MDMGHKTPACVLSDRILIQAPDAKKLLQRVHVDDINSGMFVAHAIRVLGGLDIAIALLDQPDIFKSEMNHLFGQHKDMHIPRGYFDVRYTWVYLGPNGFW